MEQPKKQHLLVQYYRFASRLDESRAVRIWEWMQVRSSHHLTAILQAGNCNQTTWQYTNWDNATHVVQPKHPANISTYLFNTTGLHEGWTKVMQLEYGNECRCAPSFILKQAITTKQPTSKQSVTTRPKWCNPNIDACLSNTTGLHGGWDKIMGINAR